LAQASALYSVSEAFNAKGDVQKQRHMFLTAATHCLSAGLYQRAARCLLLAGDHARAGELFDRLGKAQEAKKAFNKAGMIDRAALCWPINSK
jgi:hypothetical protein